MSNLPVLAISWTFFCYVLYVFSSFYWRCHQATLLSHQFQFLSSIICLFYCFLVFPIYSCLSTPYCLFCSPFLLSSSFLTTNSQLLFFNLFTCPLYICFVSNILSVFPLTPSISSFFLFLYCMYVPWFCHLSELFSPTDSACYIPFCLSSYAFLYTPSHLSPSFTVVCLFLFYHPL